ncbi:MAG: hypothetical protein HFF80_10400 [Oscillospiraceae bacterium]|jgi:hypothetical protein|nr:hypothetical protein [Oscillospiraceae bacterium]
MRAPDRLDLSGGRSHSRRLLSPVGYGRTLSKFLRKKDVVYSFSITSYISFICQFSFLSLAFLIKHLADGEERIFMGSLYVEITPKKREENGVSISNKVNSAVVVKNGGIMVRQRLFRLDSIDIYSHRKVDA